ncbi:MAG TPA: DUF2993 domain-containing protein [Mycobacteriales bacterium]|nr:DUF2993 domain-containing protein [Mycobacteriales bacterium]
MKWLIGVGVAVVLLVAADRAAAAAAEAALAAEIRTSAGAQWASADIAGFPFLAQALRGRYREVAVTARGVASGPTRVESLQVRLEDVRVPLSEALSGSVRAVPVSGVRGSAVLDYASLSRKGVAVSGRDGLLRVSGTISVLGQRLPASVVSKVRLEGGQVVAVPVRYEVSGRPAAPGVVAFVREQLAFRRQLPELPFGLRVTGVSVAAEGVAVQVRAEATVLRPR